MRTDPRTWWKDGVKPTDDDVRFAKLTAAVDRVRKEFFGMDPQAEELDPKQAMLDLAVSLVVEVATNEEGIVGADAMSDATEYVGNEAHGFVD